MVTEHHTLDDHVFGLRNRESETLAARPRDVNQPSRTAAFNAAISILVIFIIASKPSLASI